jgi:pimeloyl-ACP methyl ester carboxylesterase
MQENDEREGPWRRILLSGGAILGAAAAYNAFARKGVDKLTNLIGGEEGGFEWRDRRVAFTKRGEGPPILLVHGIHASAWSYEWRNNVDALSRTNTVYTIDLLGFGQSDRPAIRYSARLYISLISDFVSRVIDAPTVLVASSLSGAYAIVLAARDPHRFPAVALIAPSGLVRLNEPVGIGGEAGRLAVDTPIAGTAMFNALVSRPNLRRYLRNAYSNDSLVSRELVEIYYATSHQRGARHAPGAFLSGNLNIDVRHALRRLSYPIHMAESPVALLRAHARHAPWNARGLAAHATALVDAAGVRPTNASARAAPSARAVRFYVASGLLDRPEGTGTGATYGYRHLLQLLSIKIRQREGQSLGTIKTEMRDVTGDALERKIAQSLAPALGSGADEAVAHDGDMSLRWHRLSVADGIELHVREDSPAAREEAVIAMREAVRAALGRADIR